MVKALDRAPCGILTFASDGTVVDVNATLLEMLGAQRDHVIGRPFESLLTVSSRIFYQTHIFPLLALQSTVEELFVTLRSSNGGDVAVLTNIARREEGGAVLYDSAMMRLRERRKWEDEVVRARRTAEEANRATSGLLSMMSHDLRTPIGSISGYCDLLIMGIRGDLTEPQLADVQRMKKAADYLLSLIEDVLNFARLRSGQIIDLDMQPIDTAAVLTQTEALMGPRIGQAQIQYHREGCTEDVRVLADKDRLQQILLNLLTNAVKFTPAGGRITIWCRSENDKTLISVADTGRGIAADQLERIFEPFVQAKATRDQAAQKGFGLGLAISRGLARRMDGDLTVMSELGVGSTFTLSLKSPGGTAT